jgi:N-methylhydantoinase A
MSYRLGVDIGGTFTDFALFDDATGGVRTHKQLTTPRDPAEAVIAGTSTLLSAAGVAPVDLDVVAHGTTLVTNAVIERKGVRTAMLVTEGFRDVLDIAMERRYDLFDLRLRFPEPVVPRHLRIEVPGRVRYDARVTTDLDLDAAEDALAAAIERDGIEAVAICFLHSYINPDHEAAAAARVQKRFPSLAVSTSSDVFPFMREYERWTTACLNAYVQPVVDRYISRLEQGLGGLGFRGRFLIMSSSGGSLTASVARRYPVRMLESGPAAGALMSARHGRTLGLPQLLSFDMGGTTAKGCIVQGGEPLKRYEMEVARVHEFKKGSGLPIKIPVIDMIEIGAGGGSLAEVDERGTLRVGPRSAGADPGPACYGRGGARPTLTDANLVLGYLDSASFLGGGMALDTDAARAVIERVIATPLGVSLERAAWGIHEVINEDVARAFRVHASERGVDYRRCSMVAFGGSGPLHATRVARKLRIPRVICPTAAGVMSAFGLLASPIGFELVRSQRVALAGLDAASFGATVDRLVEEAGTFLAQAGVAPAETRRAVRLDMRYVGQGYELEIAVPDLPHAEALARLPALFGEAYAAIFGLRFDARPLEIVAWKVAASGPVPGEGRRYALVGAGTGGAKLKGRRPAYVPESGGTVDCPVYDRYALAPGDRLSGPALIEERESTCVLGARDVATVDDQLNLVIDIEAAP